MSLSKEDLESALAVLKDDLRSEMRGIRDELRTEMRGMNEKLRTEMHAIRDESLETVRQIETNLLTEFHRYAKGQQVRLNTLELGDAALTMRLATIEERLLALESRRIHPN